MIFIQRISIIIKMERCSYFIPDKALFGSFPDQATVDILEDHGVRYFIDLTCNEEQKIVPYTTQYKYIKYPIKDRHIPEDWKSFQTMNLWYSCKTCTI